MKKTIDNLINRIPFISNEHWLDGCLCAKRVCFENREFVDWFVAIFGTDYRLTETEKKALNKCTEHIHKRFETTNKLISLNPEQASLHEQLIQFAAWGDGFIMGLSTSYPQNFLQETAVKEFLSVLSELIRIGNAVEQSTEKATDLSIEDFKNLIEYCNDSIVHCYLLLEKSQSAATPTYH